MSVLIAAIGGWLAADGIYSFFAYWGLKFGVGDSKCQTWRDHWPRLVRAVFGATLVLLAYLE